MGRKSCILFCSLLWVLSCTHTEPENLEVNGGTGKVAVVLHTSSLVTKVPTDAAFIPEEDELKVEVFKNPGLDQIRLYRDTYGNTKKKDGIPLNCADYRILASYGDSLGVGFGEEKIYYSGTYDFTLQPNEVEEAVIEVAPSNVRTSVTFGENLNFDYSGFYAKVRSQTPDGKVKTLRFDYDETRCGFVPYGTIRVELYVEIDGVEKYYPSPDMTVQPGDDITFNLETVRLESDVNVQITASMPDAVPYEYIVSSKLLPKESPTMSHAGLSQGSFVMEPGDTPYEDLRLDIKADGEVRNCWLNIESVYLTSLGVPSRVDLASATLGLEDEELSDDVYEILKDIGLDWMNHMEGSRLAYVDFTGVTEYMSTTPCTPLFDADFSVEVVDDRPANPGSQHIGTIESDTYSFDQIIPAPVIKVGGFGEFNDNRVLILEGCGVTYDGLKADLQAKGGIAHCWLNVDSPYLTKAGVTSKRIDLANIDENGTVAETLRRFGISWTSDMAGKFDATVDFSGVSDYMDTGFCDGKTSDFAEFSIEVENAHYGSETEKAVSANLGEFDYLVPNVSILRNVLSGNVWAKFILDFAASCTIDQSHGITLPPDQFKLQYSTGEDWKDVPETTYSYPTRSCFRMEAEPSTHYRFRASYHNNPNLTVQMYSQTTEAELQLEGAGFDEWETITHTYYAEKVFSMGGINLSRDYYQPLPSTLWAVNSKRTMPETTSPNFTFNLGSISYETGETQTYKVFPTVTKYRPGSDGEGNAAQIATIHVCNMATEGNAGDGIFGTIGSWFAPFDKIEYLAAGEMCIGTSDASGNLTYGTVPFMSRPTKVSFKYQYDSKDNEGFYFKIEIRSGSEIISSYETTGGAASDWTTAVIDIPYLDYMEKATSIFMTFKSTSDSTPYYKDNGAISINVDGTDYKVHCGSVLRIDELQLLYD